MRNRKVLAKKDSTPMYLHPEWKSSYSKANKDFLFTVCQQHNLMETGIHTFTKSLTKKPKKISNILTDWGQAYLGKKIL